MEKKCLFVFNCREDRLPVLLWSCLKSSRAKWETVPVHKAVAS